MAATIENIRRKVAEDLFEFSKHAVDQSIIRGILVREVREAVANGRIIEDYSINDNDVARNLRRKASYLYPTLKRSNDFD
ncbi:DUF4258 domain-containing protein [Phormidium sp. FACHB-1136]|nr:DUF4258 domain-containing protein [Phormidium sp. FACHB-1136]